LADSVRHFENLQQISLSKNKITDAGLKKLVDIANHLKNLKIINLSCNDITDEGLKFFASATNCLKNLETIDLNNSKKITDLGLKALVDAGQLENLS
jgi:Ran GTPase-activating protein (RanGAP) involved in mRNA processing and transport